jgi:hypothetical protein
MLKKCPCIKYTCLKFIQEKSNKIVEFNTFLEFKQGHLGENFFARFYLSHS